MNVGTLFTKSARSFPERIAISYGEHEWTYAQANARINRLSNAFVDLGIKKGDHVAILQFNCPQTIETLFACFKAGLCAIHINWRLHPNEYSFIINQSDSVAVVFTEDFRDSLYSLRGNMPKMEHYICLGNPREGMLDYEELLKNYSPDFGDVEVSRDDLGWIFYTSGTTGQPKGAMLSHSNLLAMTMNFFADMSPLGQVLVQLYGQGESPMTITYLRKEEHLLEGTDEEMQRLSSVGIARTDVEVRILDENDAEVPAGTQGEVVVRGEVVMKGYWKNPAATQKTLKGGWLHTGDIGYMDAKGYVFLLDRSKDMLISGGENIYPREIEDVIIRHPAVQEVAVIGVPDDKWGEAVKAIVALKKGMRASEQEIIDFCRDNLASYKKPKSVDFVDELPKNSYGKILKRSLEKNIGKDRSEG